MIKSLIETRCWSGVDWKSDEWVALPHGVMLCDSTAQCCSHGYSSAVIVIQFLTMYLNGTLQKAACITVFIEDLVVHVNLELRLWLCWLQCSVYALIWVPIEVSNHDDQQRSYCVHFTKHRKAAFLSSAFMACVNDGNQSVFFFV